MGIAKDIGAAVQILRSGELVWHHVDNIDINFNSKLQLVTDEAHKLTIGHTGSHKQLEELFDIIDAL
jgi:hypothetical protein